MVRLIKSVEQQRLERMQSFGKDLFNVAVRSEDPQLLKLAGQFMNIHSQFMNQSKELMEESLSEEIQNQKF